MRDIDRLDGEAWHPGLWTLSLLKITKIKYCPNCWFENLQLSNGSLSVAILKPDFQVVN